MQDQVGAVGEFGHQVRLRTTWHSAVDRGYVDQVDPTTITAAHVGRAGS